MNVPSHVHGCHTSNNVCFQLHCVHGFEKIKTRKMKCNTRAVSLPPQGNGCWGSDWLWCLLLSKELILLAPLILGDKAELFFAWWSSWRPWKWLLFECSKSFLQILSRTILQGAIPCPSSQWFDVSQPWQMNCDWKNHCWGLLLSKGM